jgi:hypothetical protein
MGVFILENSGPIFKNWHVLEFVEVILGASKLLALYGSKNQKIIETAYFVCTYLKISKNINRKVSKLNPENSFKIC